MKPTHVSEGSLAAGRRVVLASEQREFEIRDVLDTAWVRGDLQSDWTLLLESLSREDQATTMSLDPDEEVLQSMSEEFRYERDLLTAEETEKWLADRDISEEDFTNFFLRRYWLRAIDQRSKNLPEDFWAASPDLRELLRIDLLLSGRFDQHARELSWRLTALPQPPGASSPADAMQTQVMRGRFIAGHNFTEENLGRALAGLERDILWLNECLQLEAAYHYVCDQLLTDEKRARLLVSLRLPLTKVEVETMVVRSPHAANEAVLCLRENQLSMSELASECDSSCDRMNVFLGDCSPELQRALLSASPGEILAPQSDGETFVVCRLINKTESDIHEQEVKARLDQRLLESHFSELTRERIRWAGAWERIA